MTCGIAIVGCIACSGLLMQVARAQALADPTRPPRQLEQGAAGMAIAGPVLQSILISPGRRLAVISGQTVRLGEQFDGARLIKVTEGEVVLRKGSELQTLKLFPDIQKQMTSARTQKNSAHRK